jgi:hypothetical protein
MQVVAVPTLTPSIVITADELNACVCAPPVVKYTDVQVLKIIEDPVIAELAPPLTVKLPLTVVELNVVLLANVL